MKSTLRLFALFVLSAAGVFAVPAHLSFTQAQEAIGALQGLDGYTVLDANNFRTVLNYDLKGQTRRNIAEDLNILKAAVLALQQTAAKIKAADGLNPDGTGGTPAQKTKADADWADATRSPLELDLKVITIDDLNLDANKTLPGSIIAALAPFSEAPAKK